MVERSGNDNLWIRCFNTLAAPKIRLVCFPHLGGSASFFVPIAAALGRGIELHAVQYPGRQDRRTETPLRDIGALADGVFDALRDRFDGPVAFFGHSMGALVAYEVAQRMEERTGDALATLVVSGRRAPSCTRPEAVRTTAHEDLREEDIYGAVAELRELRATDDLVLNDDEVLYSILPALHADYLATESYVDTSAPPLSCPIAVFVGDRDPHVGLDEAQAWSEHTTGGFELHVFPGDHFYLTDIPAAAVGRLSEVLGAVI